MDYADYKENDLTGAWISLGSTIRYWAGQGERGKPHLKQAQAAQEAIRQELRRRGALPAYMEDAKPRRLP